MSVIGYKGFDKNLYCRNVKFEVGKTYTEDCDPKTVRKGFHFCLEPFGVLKHYPMRNGNRYCIVEAVGKLSTDSHLDTKASTNKLKIIREITEKELYEIQMQYRETLDKKIRSGIDEFQRRNKQVK
jgi:hypothetical protein|uniref:DUF7666 domain-containing protein n=1 Tax=Siphoviridae sp. ctQtc11 TaxID=2825497 RepID=A0A8S5P485_9CAUD|nr:MAG TPA: hypothetical protein [Siphoviridae sp. ctQtc11]